MGSTNEMCRATGEEGTTDMGTRLRSKFTLLFIAFAVAMFIFPATAFAEVMAPDGTTASSTPTIQSDKADYAPGELVTLTGSGWVPGESVNIVVNDDVGQTWNRNVNVIADPSGNISDSFNLPDWFVATYTVTATGTQSGVATTTFTDGTVRVRAVGTAGTQPTLNWELYNNTTCTGTASNSNSIAAVGLAANGSDIPVNVNATQSLKLTPGSVPGHTFDNWTSGNFTTGTFTNTSNPGCIVGTGSGSSGGGAQNTQVNYNNAAPVVANQTVSTNVNTAKLITLGATDANNDTLTYEFVGPLPANGTLYKGDATNPTNQTNANKITGSTTLTGTAQVTYVPDNGFTGTNTFGFQATDQSATSTTATVTINVTSCTAPAITSTGQPANQSITYGANTSFTAAASGTAPVGVQWQVKTTAPGAVFTNIPTATSSPLSLTKPPVSDSGNQYRAVFTNACGSATSNPATLTVNPKSITITPNSGQSKVYGSADPTLTYSASPGLESGDNFTGALARASGNNVGNYAINLGTLSAGGNYNLSLSATPVNFEITKKALTITGLSANNKVYDGNTNATFTGTPSLVGVVGSDDVSLTGTASGTFASKEVGNNIAVTV